MHEVLSTARTEPCRPESIGQLRANHLLCCVAAMRCFNLGCTAVWNLPNVLDFLPHDGARRADVLSVRNDSRHDDADAKLREECGSHG